MVYYDDEHNNTHWEIGKSLAIITKQGAKLCVIDYKQLSL